MIAVDRSKSKTKAHLNKLPENFKYELRNKENRRKHCIIFNLILFVQFKF